MKRTVAVLVGFFLIVIPAQLFAKGDIVRITIKSDHLKTPIEIIDPKILATFNIWPGPGTGGTIPDANFNGADGFIIDWSRPALSDHPRGLRRYEVSFYAKLPNERLVYVVFYEFDPATGHGYIYLPGRADEWYRLNVGTIFRGVEGQWFRAGSEWDRVARPLIAARE
jgi:hypothetical protein